MGNFVHVELNTNNAKKAKAFYSKVFGWKMTDMPMGNGVIYTMADKMMNPGIGLQKKPTAKMPNLWMPYIAVTNAKTAVAKATQSGGKVLAPVMEVPGMGYYAWLQDPTGAMVGIWQPMPQRKKATKKKAKKKTTKKKTKKKTAKKKATKRKPAKKKAAKRAPKKKAKKRASKKR